MLRILRHIIYIRIIASQLAWAVDVGNFKSYKTIYGTAVFNEKLTLP